MHLFSIMISYKKVIWLLWVLVMALETGSQKGTIGSYFNSRSTKIVGNDKTVHKITKPEGFDLDKQTHLQCPRRSTYEHNKLTKALSFLSKRQCKSKSAYAGLLQDELFNDQWYLHDYRSSDDLVPYDLNVIRVWYELKVFGLNVKVQVLDDDFEITHPDLKDVIDEEYCLDIENKDNKPNPVKMIDAHGTSCSGIIAMRAGNKECGAGIAPMVRLGVRMKETCTTQEYYDTLTFKVEETDIKSCSWSLTQNDRMMEILNKGIMKGFQKGITKGRGGKGTLFVFSAGNDRLKDGNCSYNEVAMSMYTITVAGIDNRGKPRKTSSRCAAIMVSAPGADIISTNTNKRCIKEFSGTSGAAAMVSAIIALALEVNYEASWRDVQHMLAWTSEKAHLDKEGWVRNAAGFYHSNAFGFGRIEAYRMVTFAKSMKPVPPMNTCVLPIKLMETTFPATKRFKITFTTTGCKDLPSEINYIEHVQLVVSILIRGPSALSIKIVSPAKTETEILEPGNRHSPEKVFDVWQLDSVRTWGESPFGSWSILISDELAIESTEIIVAALTLMIHGTREKPNHYSHPRRYYKHTGKSKSRHN